jgi:predicted metal-dependent hydrolase
MISGTGPAFFNPAIGRPAMHMQKQATFIHIEPIGTILFERSKRARRLNISIKPFRGVRVAMPLTASLQQAEKFVHAKLAWIIKHLERMKVLELQHQAAKLNAPAIDRDAARRKMQARLDALAVLNGFTYNRLCIRNQKTRWGSCSATNNINLNVKLILLPERLIDYVLLHELLHTRIKNHGQEFWLELDRLTGNAKGLARSLRSYGMKLL